MPDYRTRPVEDLLVTEFLYRLYCDDPRSARSWMSTLRASRWPCTTHSSASLMLTQRRSSHGSAPTSSSGLWRQSGCGSGSSSRPCVRIANKIGPLWTSSLERGQVNSPVDCPLLVGSEVQRQHAQLSPGHSARAGVRCAGLCAPDTCRTGRQDCGAIQRTGPPSSRSMAYQATRE